MSYIIYIDESYDQKSKYIIMAGFIVPLDKWRELDNQINQLKIKYFLDSSMNLKAIRRKNYDKDNYWGSLSVQQKKEFNEEFYNLIGKSDYTLIVGIINKEKMDDKNKELLFYLAYGFIIQRYQYFLADLKDKGLIIMDIAESNEEIKNLYHVHKKFMSEGVPVKREDSTSNLGDSKILIKDYKKQPLQNICENLIFLNDGDNNILQIIDMIAAAMFAKFNRCHDIWFKKIEKIIRRKEDGKIEGYGIKFFPEK